MNPIYFAKIWIEFNGDVWKIYRYLNGNLSMARMIALYKRIDRVVPNFPKCIIKKPKDCYPHEYTEEIHKLLRGESFPKFTIEDKLRYTTFKLRI